MRKEVRHFRMLLAEAFAGHGVDLFGAAENLLGIIQVAQRPFEEHPVRAPGVDQ